MKLLSNLSKPVKWVVLPLIVIILLVLILISPILEYAIEKNSKEWVGRQILMEDLTLNLLTGNLELEGIKMFETDDKTVFVSAGLIEVNATIYKMIAGNYAVSSVAIDSMYVRIVQNNIGFNFDDLIPADDTAAAAVPEEEPVEYEIRNIHLSNSALDYINTDFTSTVSLHNILVKTDGIAWNQEMVYSLIEFAMGEKGKVVTNVDYNMNSMEYGMKVNSAGLDLAPLDPFIKDIIAIDGFGGTLGCDLLIKGNGNQPTDVALAGLIKTNDVYMTGPRKDTLLYTGEFLLEIDTINLKNNVIDLSSLKVSKLYTKFEMFDNGLNNFTALMEPDSASSDSAESEMEMSNPFTLISEYAQELRDEYDIDSYSIDSFLIDESEILFKDYTLHETFVYDITQMKVWSNNFNSKNKRVEVEFSALLNGHGHAEALYAFDPADMMEMDLYYRVTDMHVSDISPYSVFYVAHPFWSGDVTMESTTSVRKKYLESNNKLLIEKIKVGSKADKPALYDMPLKLAIAILKDPKGNIDLELPVEGDLNDPNYRIGKMVWGIIKNLLIKAATAPYKLLSGMFGAKEEDLRELNFDYMQFSLGEKQLKSLDPLIKILENKKDIKVAFRQLTEPAIEDERVASLNARRMYWHSQNGGTMTDSLSQEQLNAVESLTVKDSMFVQWVDSIVGPVNASIPVQEKIIMVCGKENVNLVKKKLQDGRNKSLLNYFISQGADTSRIEIYTEQPQRIPPNETRSKYLINFGVE